MHDRLLGVLIGLLPPVFQTHLLRARRPDARRLWAPSASPRSTSASRPARPQVAPSWTSPASRSSR
jgi:hypothetical protein